MATTESLGRAIKAGRVWTNCYHQYPAHAAFGGDKSSGVGRENHRMMLGHYTQTSACWSPTTPIRWGSSRPMTDAAHRPKAHPAARPGAAVRATVAALEVIQDLGAVHGPVILFQSAGCCDGSSPKCLKGELRLSP
jgi:hypothetical protein